MTRRAVLVGVDNYKDDDIDDLRYAVQDAFRLDNFLRRLEGPYAFESIRTLHDAGDDEVRDAIRQNLRGLKDGDLFLFYFSGHGVQQNNQHLLLCPKVEFEELRATNNTNYTIPCSFLDRLARSSSCDFLFIFDACRKEVLKGRRKGFKGRIMEGSEAFKNIGNPPDTPDATAEVRRGACAKMLSCEDGASAIENKEGGVFTQSLLSIFEQDYKNGKCLRADEPLMDRVAERMEAITREPQSPVIYLVAKRPVVIGETRIDRVVPSPTRRPQVLADTPPAQARWTKREVGRLGGAAAGLGLIANGSSLIHVLKSGAVVDFELPDGAPDAKGRVLWRSPLQFARPHNVCTPVGLWKSQVVALWERHVALIDAVSGAVAIEAPDILSGRAASHCIHGSFLFVNLRDGRGVEVIDLAKNPMRHIAALESPTRAGFSHLHSRGDGVWAYARGDRGKNGILGMFRRGRGDEFEFVSIRERAEIEACCFAADDDGLLLTIEVKRGKDTSGKPEKRAHLWRLDGDGGLEPLQAHACSGKVVGPVLSAAGGFIWLTLGGTLYGYAPGADDPPRKLFELPGKVLDGPVLAGSTVAMTSRDQQRAVSMITLVTLTPGLNRATLCSEFDTTPLEAPLVPAHANFCGVGRDGRVFALQRGAGR